MEKEKRNQQPREPAAQSNTKDLVKTPQSGPGKSEERDYTREMLRTEIAHYMRNSRRYR